MPERSASGTVPRPYFCQVRDEAHFALAEEIPGPITGRFAALARELGMVTVLPMFEVTSSWQRFTTDVVLDADGSLPIGARTSVASACSWVAVRPSSSRG